MAANVNTVVSIGSSWDLIQAVTGFTSLHAKDTLGQSLSWDKATYNRVRYRQFTIAAAATDTMDFYSWTDALGTAMTTTKIVALVLKVTGNTGVLKIEPGATNALTWFFAGTTPSISLTPTASPALLLFANPGTFVVSNTVKNLLFTNTGAATVTVTLAAVLGD